MKENFDLEYVKTIVVEIFGKIDELHQMTQSLISRVDAVEETLRKEADLNANKPSLQVIPANEAHEAIKNTLTSQLLQSSITVVQPAAKIDKQSGQLIQNQTKEVESIISEIKKIRRPLFPQNALTSTALVVIGIFVILSIVLFFKIKH